MVCIAWGRVMGWKFWVGLAVVWFGFIAIAPDELTFFLMFFGLAPIYGPILDKLIKD